MTCRLNRTVALKDKLSVELLVNALFVSEDTIQDIEDKEKTTMLLHLKPNKLEPNLIAYIRA